jgi:tRNA pseudouridine13 synthase
MSLNIDSSRPPDEINDAEPPSKRVKLATDSDSQLSVSPPTKIYDVNNLLPPSISLLGRQTQDDYVFQGSEKDVGITEYISHAIPSIDGIIKQRSVSALLPAIGNSYWIRFTDFLVYEVDLEGNVVHVRELGKPEGIKAKAPAPPVSEDTESTNGEWNSKVDAKLAELFPEGIRAQLKALYEQGPEPPMDLVDGSGEEGQPKDEEKTGEAPVLEPEEVAQPSQANRGRGRGRGRGRDRSRGRGRGGQEGTRKEDTRRVLTDVSILRLSCGY